MGVKPEFQKEQLIHIYLKPLNGNKNGYGGAEISWV
jgi:hypothetical protein